MYMKHIDVHVVLFFIVSHWFLFNMLSITCIYMYMKHVNVHVDNVLQVMSYVTTVI